MTDSRLLRLSFVWMILTLSFAILAFGAAGSWYTTVLQVSIFALGLVWMVTIAIRPVDLEWNWLCLPFGAAILIGLLQVVTGRSVYSYATWAALVGWSASLLIVLIATQVFSVARYRDALLRFALYFGSAVAALAILQHFTSGGRIYWLFETGSASPFGPFVNRNHYSAFIELLVPLALMRSLQEKSWTFGLLTAWVVASVVISGSRAGTALVIIEVLAVFVIAHSRSEFSARRVRAIAAGVCLGAGGLAVLLGHQSLSNRLQDADPLRFRREFLVSSLNMLRDRPLLGFGIGAYETAYPAYAIVNAEARVDHAHNDWAEWGAEGGLPLLLAMLSLPVLCLLPAIRTVWGIGILAVFAHSAVDFPLQIPGLAVWVYMFSACMISADQGSGQAAPAVHRRRATALASV